MLARWALLVGAAGAVVSGGCRHTQHETIPAQPFRNESEPSDGFQYSEGAAPAADAEGKPAASGTSETQIEIDVDDGDASKGPGTATAGGGSSAEEGDDGDEAGADDGSGGVRR